MKELASLSICFHLEIFIMKFHCLKIFHIS